MKLIQDGCTPRNFWGEVAPCDHLVQIYEEEAVFLDTLGRFIAAGLESEEAVVVIATEPHRRALERMLQEYGFDLAAARASNRFVALDAVETLGRFMVGGWPDDVLFRETVGGLLKRAGSQTRLVRAFGEMVALLWAQGHCAATVRLEHLWHRFCAEEGFSLLCAYPKSGFTGSAAESIRQICDAHSHVVEKAGVVSRGVSSMRELSKRIDTLA